MATEQSRPFDIVPIEEEMRKSYLDYAMSVIVARALPDVRDGLKPVQRRILFSMKENGFDPGKPHRKSARIVGDVMGKYHPHGDSAIYDAMVRMAQPFSLRLPLVDGQGNFGSQDDDPPAAMRYTEARLSRAALSVIGEIDEDTVDFRPNYDESAEEPSVLAAGFPNLLVNGAGGIAVGMATNIPPHNLGEVIDGCVALIENPSIELPELMEIIPGPDFPTAGIILGRGGIMSAYQNGRGSIVIRSKSHVEEIRKDRQAIVITEVPYQVNKARMVERIAEVVRDKKVEGIADLRDESDRQGIRVVIELKRDADPDVVLNQLWRYTPVQTSFGINIVALVGGRPTTLGLIDILKAFLEFREDVILRRSAYRLGQARSRIHGLVGLVIAVLNIDEVIALIRSSKDSAEARTRLMARDWPSADILPLLERAEAGLVDAPPPSDTYRLSEAQARAILALQLQRLTALAREELVEEVEKLAGEIQELLHILNDRGRLLEVMREELLEIRQKFADERRSVIDLDSDLDQDIEDLIQKEDMVVTVTHAGYVKRVPLVTYRAQRRGGKGRAGMRTHEDDVVTRLFVANTHTPVLFFTTAGRVYKLKVYKLPLGNPQARGRAMINLFPAMDGGEAISAVLPLPEDETTYDQLSIVFATARGRVRRNDLTDFIRVPSNGKIAMGLDEGDRLIGVDVCDDSYDMLLAARGGRAVRFPVESLRVFKSRASEGVRGMDLAKDDEVVSMSVLHHVELPIERRDAYLKYANARRRAEGEDAENGNGDLVIDLGEEEIQKLQADEQFLLTVTRNGFGKRTSAYEYRITNRGGQGVINIETSARNGEVSATFPVTDADQLMLMTDQGKLIRMPVDGIRITGRNTQGVRLFNVDEDEHVVGAVRLLDAAEDDETDEPVEE
ncbi:MAG TPA: DNA gyrase subunit A [Geminicoccus sp.]|uniref:DNA gyrase subunit A n=1 Tax=Geminicoccus sp. TaxID=2024832 RepID=UPI002B526262|nr:DNA gyrase subunit A [Geminicoccus sp.]HWL68789.1 DNA gyrase subunit A [Geminicoccus sp.]